MLKWMDEEKMKLFIILILLLAGCTAQPDVESFTATPERCEEVKELMEANTPEQVKYTGESVIYDDTSLSSEHLTPLCNDWGIDYTTFEKCAEEYKINPDYALAVFILETDHGKSNLWVKHNNPAGIKRSSEGYKCETTPSGFCSYPDVETGIEQLFVVMNRLASEYNRPTIEDMRSVWSESDDTEIIVKIMNDIRKE